MVNTLHKIARYVGFVFFILIMTVMVLKANGVRAKKWISNAIVIGLAISYVSHFILDEIKKRQEPIDISRASVYLMMIMFLSLIIVLLLLQNDVAVSRIWWNISIVGMLASIVLNFIAKEMKKKKEVPPVNS